MPEPRSSPAVRSPRVAALSALLFAADPVGITAHAESDEYDPEADTIARGLDHATSRDQVLDLVHATFVAWFTPDVAGPGARYARIADLIWADQPGSGAD